jgi:hypothetical protein
MAAVALTCCLGLWLASRYGDLAMATPLLGAGWLDVYCLRFLFVIVIVI